MTITADGIPTLKWFRSSETRCYWFSTDREFRINYAGHLGFYLGRRDWNYSGDQQHLQYPIISNHASLADAKLAAKAIA